MNKYSIAFMATILMASCADNQQEEVQQTEVQAWGGKTLVSWGKSLTDFSMQKLIENQANIKAEENKVAECKKHREDDSTCEKNLEIGWKKHVSRNYFRFLNWTASGLVSYGNFRAEAERKDAERKAAEKLAAEAKAEQERLAALEKRQKELEELDTNLDKLLSMIDEQKEAIEEAKEKKDLCQKSIEELGRIISFNECVAEKNKLSQKKNTLRETIEKIEAIIEIAEEIKYNELVERAPEKQALDLLKVMIDSEGKEDALCAPAEGALADSNYTYGLYKEGKRLVLRVTETTWGDKSYGFPAQKITRKIKKKVDMPEKAELKFYTVSQGTGNELYIYKTKETQQKFSEYFLVHKSQHNDEPLSLKCKVNIK